MANALSIAPRYQRPTGFGGTDVAWRVLCDLYPSAETPEVILAVVEYCATRKLDPLRKPVHVVPMWNSRLRRRVQVVMQGINELETTAHRTGLWAGMDRPVFGPTQTKRFKGTYENDDGSKREVEVAVEFPEFCEVTVWRIVGGEKRAFTEPVYWIEAYGRAGFRSEVPNARWTQAPRQMLHKCAKAASLRAAFPEEVAGYGAEEMDGHEVEAGGVTIEGRVDHGDPGLRDADRRIGQTPPSQPPGEPVAGLAQLDALTGDPWLKALYGLVEGATTLPELEAVQNHARVVRFREHPKTTKLLRQTVADAFTKAHDRIVAAMDDAAEAAIEDPGPPDDEDPGPSDEWQEPKLAELLAEVEAMDLVALNDLATSAAWRAKVRDAQLIQPDEETLNDAITNRKATLTQGRK